MSLDHDARMGLHAAARGRVTVHRPGYADRTGQLIAWRPRRRNARTYVARVLFDGAERALTLRLSTYHVEPA